MQLFGRVIAAQVLRIACALPTEYPVVIPVDESIEEIDLGYEVKNEVIVPQQRPFYAQPSTIIIFAFGLAALMLSGWLLIRKRREEAMFQYVGAEQSKE